MRQRKSAPALSEPTQEQQVAAANIRFLEAHPEYHDVYSRGILTYRIGAGYYEQYRYAADLPDRPESGDPR